MDTEAILSAIAADRDALARLGVAHVAVFGSRARGDHRPDSDLDVLVTVREDRRRTFDLLDVVRVERHLSELLDLQVQVVIAPVKRADVAAEIARDAALAF